MLIKDGDWMTDLMLTAGLAKKHVKDFEKMFTIHGNQDFLYPTSTVLINGEEFLAIWDTGQCKRLSERPLKKRLL